VSKTTKARKGDLILVEQVTANFYSVAAHAEAKAAGRTLPAVTTEYQFGAVASATREGEVKTWRAVGWGEALLSGHAEPIRYARRWVMTAKQIDVTGALIAAKGHHYAGHPGQPKPFGTYAEARECVRPFLTVAVRS